MVAWQDHPELSGVTVSEPAERSDGTFRVVVQFERPDVYRARVELEVSTQKREGSSAIIAMTVRSLRPWQTPVGQEVLKAIPQAARDLAYVALRRQSKPGKDLAQAALSAYRASSKDTKGPVERTDIVSFAEAASEVVGGRARGKSQAQVCKLLKASSRPEFQYVDRTLARRIERSLKLGLLDESLRATAKLRAALDART